MKEESLFRQHRPCRQFRFHPVRSGCVVVSVFGWLASAGLCDATVSPGIRGYLRAVRLDQTSLLFDRHQKSDHGGSKRRMVGFCKAEHLVRLSKEVRITSLVDGYVALIRNADGVDEVDVEGKDYSL